MNDAEQARLDAAERVCVLYGWCGVHDESERDKAAHELWSTWYNDFGRDAEKRHKKQLQAAIPELARNRDATHAATLTAYFGGV